MTTEEKKRGAISFKHDPDMFLLPDGRKVSRAKALREGYDIAGVAEAEIKRDAHASWRLAIECLPEAQERPAALAELLSTHNQTTLDVTKARAFLRGLPVETEQNETEDIMTTNHDPARAARLAEISGSVASFNRDRGWREPQGVATRGATNVPSIEPEKLKRLAEIRFNALQMNSQGHTQEAKKIKCALDAHATTGAPLSRLLAQLEVDTSKFVRNV